MMRRLALVVLAGLARPAWAACPASPAALRAEMDGAYASYAAFDLSGFSVRAVEVDAELGCLNGALDPETAARAHLVAALRAWVAKDPVQMLSSFRGMLAADPAYTLSPDIAPQGSRVRTVYEEARTAGGGAIRPVAVGPGVVLTVDGRRGLDALPADRASVVQVAPPGGRFRAGTFPERRSRVTSSRPPPVRHPRSRSLRRRSRSPVRPPPHRGPATPRGPCSSQEPPPASPRRPRSSSRRTRAPPTSRTTSPPASPASTGATGRSGSSATAWASPPWGWA